MLLYKLNYTIKKNNRGLSLVELLVAMAVAAILLSILTVLVQQSVKGYNSQTTMSELQNDANITMNHIEDSIMSADMVTILSEGSEQKDNSNTEYLIVSDNIVYIYKISENRLYLANGIDSGKSDYTESLLCDNVTSFQVRIIESSIFYSEKLGSRTVSSINNPVRLSVLIRLDKNDKTREITKDTNVRNTISKIVLKVGNNQSDILVNRENYESIKTYLK